LARAATSCYDLFVACALTASSYLDAMLQLLLVTLELVHLLGQGAPSCFGLFGACALAVTYLDAMLQLLFATLELAHLVG
jgi:hypothetical protein